VAVDGDRVGVGDREACAALGVLVVWDEWMND
jgi:hypothetical protein